MFYVLHFLSNNFKNWKKKLNIFLMCIFSIIHTASTDDVLLRNLAKVRMIKDEFENNCFSFLTKILLPKK